MIVEVVLEKKGKSVGFILPERLVKEKNIKEHDKIIIEVIKKIP